MIARATSSSKVQLTFMGLFHAKSVLNSVQLSSLEGCQAVWHEAGMVHITADSVPFHQRCMDGRAPQPGRGLLALFGIRDALDELQYWRTVARNSQAQFAYIQLQVDVGSSSSGVLKRSELRAQGSSLRFLNVRRCAADMQKQWLSQFAQWVQAEGGDAQRDMQHVRHMAHRPDLFERLLHEDPDLQHIDVMVLPLADRAEPARTRQVAYLRAGAKVVSAAQGSDQIRMHLPEWMGAAAQRVG